MTDKQVDGVTAGGLEAALCDPRASTRLDAVKEVAQQSQIGLLGMVEHLAKGDPSQQVRREAASAIGRMSRMSPQAFAMLADLAAHDDPGVVVQAARGLMAAKNGSGNGDGRTVIAEALIAELAGHANEVVRHFVRTEQDRKTGPRFVPNGTGGSEHAHSPSWLQNVVVNGDALESLKRIPAESVHLTFTSPPYYNARDYSIYPSYDAYLDFLSNVFSEVHRVTKEGRFFVLNTSPVIIPRAGRQHESHRYAIPFDLHPRMTQIGWKFVDDIIWEKPAGAAKPRNSGFAVHRQPLTYKANAVTEYVMVYRKESTRLIDWNLRQYDRATREGSRVSGDYESTNVWEIDPTTDHTHSAVFPVELCERVITYYSMVNDLVLDPFAGSGTVGVAAQRLQRKALLLELNDRYVRRISQRLGLWAQVVPLAEFGADDGTR